MVSKLSYPSSEIDYSFVFVSFQRFLGDRYIYKTVLSIAMMTVLLLGIYKYSSDHYTRKEQLSARKVDWDTIIIIDLPESLRY